MLRKWLKPTLLMGLLAALSFGVIASSNAGERASQAQKKGGTLNYLTASDVDFVDPGQTFYNVGYQLAYATNRGLYYFKPGSSAAVPDLATGKPQISKDKKQVTVKIRSGIKYAPGVKALNNRVVQAKDIKYAFERAFTTQVPNPYVTTYFKDIVGAPSQPVSYSKAIGKISGIQVKDKNTIVFKLRTATAAVLAQALTLPITIPVPQEYAAKYDKAKGGSTYDQYVAFTGPYMIPHNSSGKLTGRQPGTSIKTVRNPNWNAKSDFRKAYLDKVDWKIGTDPLILAKQVIAGPSATGASGSPAYLEELLKSKPSQLQKTPTTGIFYVSLNTRLKPLNNINVLKALFAISNRLGWRQVSGGTNSGTIPNQFIPTAVPGFSESGGKIGFKNVDFSQNQGGNAVLAKKYMLAAKSQGLPINSDGVYTGGETLSLVTTTSSASRARSAAVQSDFAKLGIKVQINSVPGDQMYVKFCNNPSSNTGVCTSVGWGPDFLDPVAALEPVFNGNAITPTSTSNQSLLNNTAINNAFNKARLIPAGQSRWDAYAAINKLIVGQASALPWLQQINWATRSTNVVQSINPSTTLQDFAFMSLK